MSGFSSSCNDHSFFQVFNFDNLVHDAADHCLVYEGIEITRDITFPSGKKLVKGQKFHAVWFYFKDAAFDFIDWKLNPEIDEYEPDPETWIKVSQSEMAPFLHWNEPGSKPDCP